MIQYERIGPQILSALLAGTGITRSSLSKVAHPRVPVPTKGFSSGVLQMGYAKNPGIGRGNRPGEMTRDQRIKWIAKLVEQSHMIQGNDETLKELYAEFTGMKPSAKQFGKDLLYMYELGILDRREKICRGGRTYMYWLNPEQMEEAA